ncbi:hypothetical protein [Paenibacillus hexagrammi]|uniref:Uncharacterized protein n=1 Tax=Paenibacillus hexagrammi TaxID=2908839 RepID=A0ABY3SND2_9BACL|nr:hypothetical protein [Paenibacillus sp. YPD9-1]UJF35418.1 hypothetical protein L0M14_10120 [Paenibacillus sp. YPD9-1]
MNPDFIKIKTLDGDLKMSHKKRDYGLTVSTHELVLHKPHVNYYFKLKDIISIVPYEPAAMKSITFVNWRSSNQETTHIDTASKHYRIFVKGATVHNRSGIFTLGATDVIIPIHSNMMEAISECVQHQGLTAF